ncbi:MAG: hypothetical protein QXF12_00855 [Candidatus Aenigmatarchaeota archaeon]
MKVALVLSPLNSIMAYKKINHDIGYEGHLISRFSGINIMKYLYLDIINMKPEDEIEVDDYNLIAVDRYYANGGFFRASILPGVKEIRAQVLKELMSGEILNAIVQKLGEKNTIELMKNNGIDFIVTIPHKIEEDIIESTDKFIQEQDRDLLNVIKNLEQGINL